ncbi:ribulokinase, partial [Propionibacterium freudenreichii]|nr:ribulokinase [Propionibacterium freudenreichii]
GALGSAIFATVAAGAYPDVRTASAAMGSKAENVNTPDPERSRDYDLLYAEYSRLHDYFGRGANPVMHRLKEIRRDALARTQRIDNAELVAGAEPLAGDGQLANDGQAM